MTVLRPPMSPLAHRVRAYFAPVARDSGTPAIFDPAAQPAFALESAPAPWIDAAWIDHFQRTPATRIQQIRSGPAGAPNAQFRSQLSTRIEFDFREWGKLQMAIASGAESMNVLATASGVPPHPAGGAAIPAVPLQPGSTATILQLTSAAIAGFSTGDLLAVDLDYQQQTGFIGSGIAAAFIALSATAPADIDFIRRVTFNVARVAAIGVSSLTLAQPLLGGAPPAGAAIQKVMAFVDREGGSFFQEWSGLFVIPEESGGRVCIYYPRLQAAAPAQEKTIAVAGSLQAHALHAALEALPYADPADGQQVLCYRSYMPATSAAVY